MARPSAPITSFNILYYKPNIPIAIIEAKDNNHSIGDGIEQALDYAVTLNIPFVFSSNGDGFVFHDRTGTGMEKEASLSLDAFPSPKEIWSKYRAWKGLTPDEEEIVLQDYFEDGSGKGPRYYQTNAINAAIEAIAKGQNRILLVMATGTGKTYTAFQIIWRLWKAGRKKRILFLADRNVLVDQTMTIPTRRETVFDFITAEDVLPKVLTGYGLLPAVVRTSGNTGPWDRPGSARTVHLADGTTAREQVTAYERPKHFAYRTSDYAFALRYLARLAQGQWWFEDDPNGTKVRWTYTFHAKGRLTSIPLRMFAKTQWVGYMRACIRNVQNHSAI